MKITIAGKMIGCYQDDAGFFVRIRTPEFPKQEAELPITNEQFQKLRFEDVTLTLEVVSENKYEWAEKEALKIVEELTKPLKCQKMFS